MVIETDTLDFVSEPEDRFEILSRVESRLYGLFPERSEAAGPVEG